MSYGYTQTLIKGFGTSIEVQEMHYHAALKINAAIKSHQDLMADKTRSRGEKSPMLARMQQKLEKDARQNLESFQRNLEARRNSIESQAMNIKNSMSMEKALPLVLAMKGMDAAKMVAVCKANKELALAMSVVPTELSGFNQELAFDTLIASHYPGLKEASDALEGDIKAFESLSNNLDSTVRALGNDVDWNAMQGRFDEKRLDPTPTPRTMHEQNQQLAELEKAAGIKPTVGE